MRVLSASVRMICAGSDVTNLVSKRESWWVVVLHCCGVGIMDGEVLTREGSARNRSLRASALSSFRTA